MELGQAWGTRSFATSKALLYIIPVTNRTNVIYCEVRAVNVVWRDAGGAPVYAAPAGELTPLYGTVAVARGEWNSFCAGPGETGYLLDIQVPPDGSPRDYYTETVRLELAVRAPATADKVPPARVLPTSYAVAPGMFRITVHNEGPSPARLSSLSPFVMFDAQGPVAWNLVEPMVMNQVLAVGAEGTLFNKRPNTESTADRVRPLIEFEDPATPVTIGLHVTSDHGALVAAAAARRARLLRASQDAVQAR
jgi:hypothetical protein